MWFFPIFLAVVASYIIQMILYKKYVFNDFEYSVKLNVSEVFINDDIFLYEEISNNKNLPLPCVKIDTELPEGMQFCLMEVDNKGAVKKTLYQQHTQSVFVLANYQKIKRRWRVTCRKRGTYHLGSVLVVANDLFGFNSHSKRYEITPTKYNELVVLPKIIDIDDNFTSAFYHNGDIPVTRSLLTDPLKMCGMRDYTPFDPMNKINWKSTAVHNKLMVNVEEYTERHHFNIIMNMNSRDIERNPDTPSVPEYIELCISVCASILDIISSENIPARFITNTPPELIKGDCISDDETGKKILISKPFRGKFETINALRLLASLQYKISCPVEQMLDHIVKNPFLYTNSGNIIFVSTYISERMIIFHDILKKSGVKVAFFIMSTNQNAMDIPDDIEIYYKNELFL